MTDIVHVSELKSWLRLDDSYEDPVLSAVIASVTRKFENWCHRRFVAATETRYYTARNRYCLSLGEGIGGDLLSISASGLVTDEDGDRVYEVTWLTTDYDLEPANAALDGLPYTELRVTPDGTQTFPVGIARGVKITGLFGLAATVADLPADLTKAALLECEKDFRGRDAPTGIAAGGEFQTQIQMVGLHPFVRQQLAPYVVPTVA